MRGIKEKFLLLKGYSLTKFEIQKGFGIAFGNCMPLVKKSTYRPSYLPVLFRLSYFEGVLSCVENVCNIYSIFWFVDPIDYFVAFEYQISEFLRTV